MTQVISAINFPIAKIMHGEEATPMVMNRPLLACMDADARLEESVQYIARSMSLLVTDKTRFLAHFDGEGIDAIGSVSPETSASITDVFKDDGIFYSSAFVQSSCTNILGNIANFDSSLKTLNGWTVFDMGAGNTNITVNRKGLTITNKGVKADITPGMPYYITPKFDVTANSYISFGVEGHTDDNLAYNGAIVAGVNIKFLDSSDGVLSTVTASTSLNRFRGVLKCENVLVPVGAVKAYHTIFINYPAANSKAAFTFTNLMCEVGPFMHSWTATTRPANTLRYPRVITTGNKVASVVCWNKFGTQQAINHVGPIGPLFLVDDANLLNIGAVHDSADGSTYKLKLRVLKNGVATWGNEIILPPSCRDTYIPAMLRLSAMNNGSADVIRMEYVTIDLDLNVYKSTVELPAFDLPPTLDIRIGSDMATTEYYNNPISELRYDEEWLNDFELSVIALAKHPFTVGDKQFITIDDMKTYLDNLGINLIKNPDGRLGLYHWSGYVQGKFFNVVSDVLIGSGFKWVGTADSDTYVESESIPVHASKPYSFRAELNSDDTAVGQFGLALRFFKTDGTQTGPTSYAICMNGFEPEYYSITTNAPTDAVSAKVYMYIANGFIANKATWSRLKFELGSEPTMYTDDFSPKHALLAP